MKRALGLLSLCLAWSCHAPGSEPAAPTDGADTGTQENSEPNPRAELSATRMVETITHLAADELRGRYTLSDDIRVAATWLSERYAKAGLEPVGDSFVHEYPLRTGVQALSESKLIAHPTRGDALPLATGAFTPLASSGSGTVRAPAVFVGYAVQSDPDESGAIAYDDLEGVDLEGKVAVLLLDAPGTPDFRATFEFFEEVAEDYATKAAPLLAADDREGMLTLHKDARERLAVVLRPWLRGKKLPESYWKVSTPMVDALDVFGLLGPVIEIARDLPGPRFQRGTQLETKLERLRAAKVAGVVVVRGPRSFIEAETRDEDPLPALAPTTPEVLPEPMPFPVVQMRWHEARDFLKKGGVDLEKVQTKLDTKLVPASKAMKYELELVTDLQATETVVPNVLAKIPGGDLADEYVLFGAHFDHIGTDELGDCNRVERKNDGVCNGADDNASGTAMVLELARAIRASGYQPRRTLLFAGFSGEEMGLLGSEAMADNFPLDTKQLVAMVNLDMVGRLSVKGLAIGGISTSAEWMPLLDAAGTQGMEITYERSVTSRSDHANFFRLGVPVLFFFTGTHSDYHRAGDQVEEINAEGMQSIGNLVMSLALDLASGTAMRWREPPEGEGLVGRLPGTDDATIEKKVEADD